MSPQPIIIGTRGSELALWQAHETQRLLGAESELKIIRTSGDNFQNIALQGQLEQGFFTKDIETELLAGSIDVAVHSLKDLPTALAPGLVLGAHLKRAPVSDLLLIHPDWHDAAQPVPLREGCSVGATSLRRQALLRLHAPQSHASMLRGNVPGRLAKCAGGSYGAIILARAGIARLGLNTGELLVYEMNPELWLPAPGQGAIAIQAREGDARVLNLLAQIDDAPTREAVALERRLLANFEGGCHTAFGAWAQPQGDHWQLQLGMEEDGNWGSCVAHGALEQLETLGPRSGLSFAARTAGSQEELCRPLRL